MRMGSSRRWGLGRPSDSSSALDHELGTGPLFVVAFGTLAFLGAVLALYFRYQAAMAREEADKPWNRRQW